MSTQPTHHGYAVNVKDHTLYAHEIDVSALSDTEAEAVYDGAVDGFWYDAREVARGHGFQDVYSEGRMGGWAVPVPQPHTEDMWDHEVEAWERDRFRPFERDILALLAEYQVIALDALREAAERAAAEPAERAHWEARDTVTID